MKKYLPLLAFVMFMVLWHTFDFVMNDLVTDFSARQFIGATLSALTLLGIKFNLEFEE